jgi:predicted nicotinamide N-methyase
VDLAGDFRAVPVDAVPYWAFCWGSGQLTARFILDCPEKVRGRRVVDFGAGSGVVAIAAGLAGASAVIACDLDPAARSAVVRNARRNHVSVEVTPELPALERGDLLIAADICYEPELADALAAQARRGVETWVADPGRRALPFSDPEVEPEALAQRRALRTFPDPGEGPMCVSLYRLPGPVDAVPRALRASSASPA